MNHDKSQTTIPSSPWKPHGPVQYLREAAGWGDQERAAYIMHDIQMNGIDGIDDDQWVADFLVRLLWAEIQKGVENA